MGKRPGPTPEAPKQESDVIDFTVQREERIPLRDMEGKVIIIAKVEVYATKRGDMLVIEDHVGNRYYTFSEVIYQQLKPYLKELEAGKKLRAKVERVRNVLRLAPPS